MGLLDEEESYRVLGACFEVYKEKGPGFLEPVYPECRAIEFELSGIPFRSKAELKLEYKGRGLKQTYHPDFIVIDKDRLAISPWSLLLLGPGADVLTTWSSAP